MRAAPRLLSRVNKTRVIGVRKHYARLYNAVLIDSLDATNRLLQVNYLEPVVNLRRGGAILRHSLVRAPM